jgi:hypothetical protein
MRICARYITTKHADRDDPAFLFLRPTSCLPCSQALAHAFDMLVGAALRLRRSGAVASQLPRLISAHQAHGRVGGMRRNELNRVVRMSRHLCSTTTASDLNKDSPMPAARSKTGTPTKLYKGMRRFSNYRVFDEDELWEVFKRMATPPTTYRVVYNAAEHQDLPPNEWGELTMSFPEFARVVLVDLQASASPRRHCDTPTHICAHAHAHTRTHAHCSPCTPRTLRPARPGHRWTFPPSRSAASSTASTPSNVVVSGFDPSCAACRWGLLGTPTAP